MNGRSRALSPLWADLKKEGLVQKRLPIVLLCLAALALGVFALLAVVSASEPGVASEMATSRADRSIQWCAQATSFLAARTETLDEASESQFQAMASALDEACDVSPASQRSGEEASSIRWCAQAKSYLAARTETLDEASELRYQAMARALDEDCSASPATSGKGEEARSARWSALGAYHTARYEAAAAASSARYRALAEGYAQRDSNVANSGGHSGDDAYDPAAGGNPAQSTALAQSVEASSARWAAWGAYYAAKYEAAAAASSARYQAMAEWYGQQVLQGRH
jgi:hypothetical protein